MTIYEINRGDYSRKFVAPSLSPTGPRTLDPGKRRKRTPPDEIQDPDFFKGSCSFKTTISWKRSEFLYRGRLEPIFYQEIKFSIVKGEWGSEQCGKLNPEVSKRDMDLGEFLAYKLCENTVSIPAL